MVLVVKGDERIVRRGEDTVSKATFTIDATKQPTTIDVTVSDGPLAGKTLVGIYELMGDSLKICLAMTGDKRPDDFTAKDGSERLLQEYKKIPAKKAAP
jgi:uncharacterized protein (TIGR03067 family)